MGLFLVQKVDSSSYVCSLLSKSKSRCHHSIKQQGSEPCNLRIPCKVKDVKRAKDLSGDPAAGEGQKRQAYEGGKRASDDPSQAGAFQLMAGGRKGSVG